MAGVDAGLGDSPGVLTGDPVVNEAKKRFDRCAEFESNARVRFIDDIKFAHGDAANGYQWPNAIRRARDLDDKPCLTLNVVRQHNLQIVNDSKQNKTSMQVMAVGNGATFESAQMLQACIRHIEYQSEAQSVYATGSEFQVYGGIGWWRLVTRYRDEDSFDQEIYLERIKDPLSVFMDPDIKQMDGSDAKFALVFDNVLKDEFDEAYPEYKGVIGNLQPMGVGASDSDWVTKDYVRVCEYFRLVETDDVLWSFVDPTDGQRKSLRESLMPDEVLEAVRHDRLAKWRPVKDTRVEWSLIVGDQIVDETTWPGKYIPLIRVVGEEITIDGVLDRKGHTRAMLDAQRMYNYNASSQVEFVALQGKTPWIAPSKAIEQMETYWNTANTVNHSVLPWNHIDDDGNPVPPPFKDQPPNASPAYEAGMTTAFNQMMMVSGQWQNQMGMGGNERTGEAISRRQAQGDTAVYHFFDNYESAIRYTSRQLIDLIPRIYDTKRVLKCQADDGEEFELLLDPGAKEAYTQQIQADGKVVKRVFNPTVGIYDVMAGAGPSYGTQREETVKALTLILTQAPQLTGVIGDLLLQAMNFKEAQEAARRLKRMVPGQALGTGPSPEVQGLQQQVTQLQAALAKSLERQGKDTLKLVGKDQLRDIEAYRAETERMKALTDALPLDAEGLREIITQLVQDSIATHLLPVLEANKAGLVEQSDSTNQLGGQ